MKNCKYIDEEIDHLQHRMLKCMNDYQKLHDQVHTLKELKEKLLCPEDTSKEAKRRNKDLANIVIKEIL